MKKTLAVVAIAVCFLMVGFGYSYAQQPNMAGPLSSLSLKITYQQHIPAKTSTATGSESVITVPSSLNEVVKGTWEYDPTAYISINTTTGLISGIWISWLDPNVNDKTFGDRILTILCAGGNSASGNPDPNLPEPTDGSISSRPSVSSTATTVTSSFEAVAVCWVCPSGFAWNTTTKSPSLTGLCHDGSSYVSGYITYTGTSIEDTASGYVTNINIASATVSAAGFNYIEKLGQLT